MLAAFPVPGLDVSALLREMAREAGLIAQGYFRLNQQTTARIWSKVGGSPVTEADVSVDAFLKVRLSSELPQAGWLSEETRDDLSRMDKRLVWIVDPIDGTRAFMAGDPDWSISIALLADGQPVAGVVHAPALGALYEAGQGGGSFRNGNLITASGRVDLARARVAGPRPLVDALERETGAFDRAPRMPSLALRLARVAEGAIDVGLVSRDARDWDIAAADLIIAEAGGCLTAPNGKRPVYNQREPVHGTLVSAGPHLHDAVLQSLGRVLGFPPGAALGHARIAPA
jgi:myo-inositol-1(or 4)-monophosphatase